MVLKRIYADGKFIDITGEGYDSVGEVSSEGRKIENTFLADDKNTLKHFKETSDIFFVAIENWELLGFIRWTKDKIINIYISTKYQWKWIWKSLMDSFEDEAKNIWSNKIILKPSKYAYNFYIKNGYKKLDEKYLEKFL